jgi:hypothetical protein
MREKPTNTPIIQLHASARHLSLSWANSIQSPRPPPTSWRSILISSHLRLGLPNDLFPSGFPTNNLCTPLSSTVRATCPAHLILLDFTTSTILGKEYRSFSSSPTCYEFLPSVNVSILLLLIPPEVQVFSSAPCSNCACFFLRLTASYMLCFFYIDFILFQDRFIKRLVFNSLIHILFMGSESSRF